MLVRLSPGKCQFWMVPVLGDAGFGIMPVLGAINGQCQFWERPAMGVGWKEDAGQSNGSVQEVPSFIIGQVEFWQVPDLV